MSIRALAEAKLNDEFWSCLVFILAEYNVNFELDVESFKTFALNSGTRDSIEIITPKDVENKKLDEDKSAKSGKRSKFGPNENENIAEMSEERKLALNLKKVFLNAKDSRIIKYIPIETSVISVSKKDKANVKSTDEKIQLNDGPKCGPNKFFILMELYETTVIEELLKIKVPVIGVICYGKEEKFLSAVDHDANDDQSMYAKKQTEAVDARSSSGKEKGSVVKTPTPSARTLKVQQFWYDLIEFIENPLTNHISNDLAIISCDQPLTFKYPVDEEILKDKGPILYDHISLFLYSIASDYRKYIHYVNTANIVEIPAVRPLVDLPLDFKYYTEKVNDIPLEYASIEFILYCMVEHVANELDRNTGTNTEKNSVKYDKSEPYIINSNDKIKRTTFNIKSPDICALSLNIHKQMPYNKLLKKHFNENAIRTAKIKSQLNLLYECLDNFIDYENFTIILHQILFTQMYDLIATPAKLHHIHGKTDELKEQEQVIVEEEQEKLSEEQEKLSEEQSILEEPKIERNEHVYRERRQKQIEKLKNFFYCEEIENLKQINFENNAVFEYSKIKELNESEMLQCLQRSINKYTSMNFQPFSGTDSVLIFFHNDFNEYGIYRNHNHSMLGTPVGFRDYYAYVKDNIKSWMDNQKKSIKRLNKKWRNKHVIIKNNIGELVEDKDTYPHPCKANGSTPAADGFTLYNITDHAVLAGETISTFYSVDGVQLKTEIDKLLYSNVIMKLSLKSFGTKVIHYHVLNDRTNTINDLNYINVFMKNGIIINCKQEFIEQLVPAKPVKTSLDTKESKKKVTIVEDIGTDIELKDKYNIDIVLPNGLKIEIRYDRDYIKQYYLEGSHVNDNVKGERFRIFLKNGTVLIYNKDGTIMVLYNNGTKINVRKILQKKIPIEDEDSKVIVDDTKYSKKSIARSSSTKKSIRASRKKTVTAGDKGKKGSSTIVEKKEIKTRLEYEIIDMEAFSWNGEYYMYCNDTYYDISYPNKLRIANSGYQFIFNKTDGASTLYLDTCLKMLYPDGTLIITRIVDDPADPNIYNPFAYKEGIELDTEKLFHIQFETYFSPYFIKKYPNITSKLLDDIQETYLMCYPKLDFKKMGDLDEIDTEEGERIQDEVFDQLIAPTSSQEALSKDETNEKDEEQMLLEYHRRFELEEDDEFFEATYEILSAEYSVQHSNYAHVNYNSKYLNWIVKLPDDITVFSGNDAHYIMNPRTQILIKEKCFKIVSKSDEEDSCDTEPKFTTTKFYVPPKSEENDNLVCKIYDSANRTFLIRSNGIISYIKENFHKPFYPEQKKLFNKFIVLKKNMSGYEFLHEKDNLKRIHHYIKMAPENQVIDINLDIYAHTYTIDKTLSEKYEIPIKNPFKTIDLSRRNLSNYFTIPQKWLFNLEQPKSLHHREIKKKFKKPIAAIYRRIRNGYTEYDRFNIELKKAYDKIDKIKSYICSLYEYPTLYRDHPEAFAHRDKVYRDIFKYIGSAKNLET